MSDDEIDAYIAVVARVLTLQIEPEWQSTVRLNLATTLKFAEVVMQSPLPDDAEPAPAYRA